MAEQFIRCPKDPQIEYRREVCENIFRKDNFRTWCRECQNFQAMEKTAQTA